MSAKVNCRREFARGPEQSHPKIREEARSYTGS